MTHFDHIKAFAFDAYGTLFDVHSAVGEYREKIGGKADQLSALWRSKQLEYTWLRSLMGVHADFWQVTQDALDYTLDSHDIDDEDLRENLMNAYLRLACYPEVKNMLAELKDKGMRVTVLSNGSPDMLEAALQSSGLNHDFDAIFSVEEVGIYKPHPSVYQIACDYLKLKPEEICFQSSNAWDAAGAAQFGFKVVWINRFGQKRERLPKGADMELQSLEGLPGLVG